MIYVYHAVRRGLEHSASTTGLFKRDGQDGPQIEIPPWGAAVFIVTAVILLVFMSAVSLSSSLAANAGS